MHSSDDVAVAPPPHALANPYQLGGSTQTSGLSWGVVYSQTRLVSQCGPTQNAQGQPTRYDSTRLAAWVHSQRPSGQMPSRRATTRHASQRGSQRLRLNAQQTWYNSTRLVAWVHSQRLRPNAQPTWYNSTRLVAWVHSQRPAGVLLHSPGSIQGFPKIGHIPSKQLAKKTNCGSKRSPAAFHHGNLSQSRVDEH